MIRRILLGLTLLLITSSTAGAVSPWDFEQDRAAILGGDEYVAPPGWYGPSPGMPGMYPGGRFVPGGNWGRYGDDWNRRRYPNYYRGYDNFGPGYAYGVYRYDAPPFYGPRYEDWNRPQADYYPRDDRDEPQEDPLQAYEDQRAVQKDLQIEARENRQDRAQERRQELNDRRGDLLGSPFWKPRD